MAAALPRAVPQGRMDDYPKDRSLNWLDRETQQRLCRQGREVLQRAQRRAVNRPSLVEDLRGERKPINLNTSFNTMMEYMDYVSSQCGRFHSVPEKAAMNHVCRYHQNHVDPMSSSWVRRKKSTSHDARESYQVTNIGPGPSTFDPESSRFDPGPSKFDPGPSKFDPGSSRFDPGSSRFDPGPSSLGPGPSKFYPGPSRFDPGPSKFDTGSSRFDPGPSRFDPGPSRFDPGPSRFDTGPSKFDPGPFRFDTGSSSLGPESSESMAGTSSKDITIEVCPGTYTVTVGSPNVTTTHMIEVDSGEIIDLSFPL
ncbi:A-kinase-interacting protein 1 isoform X2 [Vombatus ursinus]|uniref:A-kinase-interacting protein 1 isoform X2 n=1 Tax=Vombatus ursinus TaxID=29139 RepID=UPI000FFD4AA1|nr:A-kinase-interacting protein 1 isoform X2 [Vombatus ursinus]